MSKLNKGAIQTWLPTIVGIIIVLLIGGGILAWQYWWASREEVKVPEVKAPEGIVPEKVVEAIGPSAVWDSEKCWPECIVKWHECKNLDCISGVMEQYGASSDAKNFTKLLPERGFLMQFQEMGKIDLGIVAFPDRANTNEEYYLLNGFPPLVGTGIKEEEFMDEIKQDLLYPEMKEKYPNIWFWGIAPQFVEKKALPNNNERFIFTYRFVNGCRACNTEYSAKIGFDFDSDKKFLKIIFLQIVKE